MEPEDILQAVLILWDELPRLVGPAWVDLYPQIADLVARLQRTQDLMKRTSLVADMTLLLQPYPQARQRLREVVDEISQEREAVTRLSEERQEHLNVRYPDPLEYAIRSAEAEAAKAESQTTRWSDLLDGLRRRLDPPPVTRYTDITAPRRLARGRRGVITVGLTRAPRPESEEAHPLEILPNELLEIHLQAHLQDFEIIGDLVKRLPVEAEKDTEPVVFYIKGLSLGTKRLTLDFRQSGVTIGTVRLVIEVTQTTVSQEQLQKLTATLNAGGPYAPPPDLDIRVTVRSHDGQTRLDYVLHSPNGAADVHYHHIEGRTIVGSPAAYQARQMEKIEALAAGRDVDGHPLTPQQVENKLRAIGRLLFAELFSDEMRSAYRRFREDVRTLQITSDEPWIPWELVRPYDASDPANVIDDDFLCARFQMTRWLAGRGQGSGKIEIRRAACVEAGQALSTAPLQYAQAEKDYLIQLMTSCGGVEDLSPDPATGAAVDALLDAGDIDLWHFAAHGNVDFDHPNESVVILADRRGLRPEDIHGPRQTHIARDKPLVFLNACRVGQQSWSLTQLGGWVQACVGRSRCGAFVGPLWSVNDWLAYEFARTFYDALQQGEIMGQAARTARERIRGLAPHNPTWLAYSVYAHPNARVVFGNQGQL